MKVEYFKEYSNCLNRNEFKIYGHTGIPLLVFLLKMVGFMILRILVW